MILGGLELCLSPYLCHAQSGLRWRAAELIASCAQNMPQVQVHLLSIGALPKLLQLTDSDPNPTVRVKALYAVSCEYLRLLKKIQTTLLLPVFMPRDVQCAVHLRTKLQLSPVVTLGLVREQEVGLQAFLSHDGFSVLMRGMQSDNEKLRTKSAFLLLNLLTSHPEQKGTNERRI